MHWKLYCQAMKDYSTTSNNNNYQVQTARAKFFMPIKKSVTRARKNRFTQLYPNRRAVLSNDTLISGTQPSYSSTVRNSFPLNLLAVENSIWKSLSSSNGVRWDLSRVNEISLFPLMGVSHHALGGGFYAFMEYIPGVYHIFTSNGHQPYRNKTSVCSSTALRISEHSAPWPLLCVLRIESATEPALEMCAL